MEIIKHGNLRSRHFTCPRCSCEFIADASEYWQTEYAGTILWYQARCPECGMDTADSEIWEGNDGK